MLFNTISCANSMLTVSVSYDLALLGCQVHFHLIGRRQRSIDWEDVEERAIDLQRPVGSRLTNQLLQTLQLFGQ